MKGVIIDLVGLPPCELFSDKALVRIPTLCRMCALLAFLIVLSRVLWLLRYAGILTSGNQLIELFYPDEELCATQSSEALGCQMDVNSKCGNISRDLFPHSLCQHV